jgi:starch-binding outer membrane protein, SusD/RagB family
MTMRRTWRALVALTLAACSLDDVAGESDVPAGINDPAATETPEGALAAYRGALLQVRVANDHYVAASGLLSDELQNAEVVVPGFGIGQVRGLDARLLPEVQGSQDDPTSESTYQSLQKARGQAAQAAALLRDFAPNASPALRGHMYAVVGYSELLLAELFCSGIPLSTLDYRGDYTLEPGSTTTEVLEHAGALFDTALGLSADSARILQLARMGRARAWLGLGQLQLAAQEAAQVADGFQYALTYDPAERAHFAAIIPGQHWQYSVSDREGTNGLDFRSSGDPRTRTSPVESNTAGVPLFYPDKYTPDGTAPVVLASGVEARLIQAEAAAAANEPSWLTILNALRTSGTFDTQPNPDDPAVTDTLWHPGTGGVAGLAPLEDPGADGRIDLVFRERAFWLFLTGQRQGDLRRLIRQYDRDQSEVYPVGVWDDNQMFGSDVTAPIPGEERQHNPLFDGCESRGA